MKFQKYQSYAYVNAGQAHLQLINHSIGMFVRTSCFFRKFIHSLSDQGHFTLPSLAYRFHRVYRLYTITR